MIKILYSILPETFSSDELEKYLVILPEDSRERANNFLQLQHQYAYVYGRMMLRQGFASYSTSCGPCCQIENIELSSHQRPYLPASSLDFNLSHSGQYVVAAFGKGIRLGIDIEKIRPIKFEHFDNWFNQEDWIRIKSSTNPLQTFFHCWAQKESVMKADGRGFSLPPAAVSLQYPEAWVGTKKWQLQRVNIHPDYACFLSTDSLVNPGDHISLEQWQP